MADDIEPVLSPETVTDAKVGYRRPPVEHQIKPGERRNPKGRPRKNKESSSENTIALFAVVLRVLDQKIDTTVGGRRKQVRLLEILVNQLAQKALKGDEKALAQLLKLVEKAGVAALEGRTGEPIHIIVEGGLPELPVLEPPTDDELPAPDNRASDTGAVNSEDRP
nr:DUF5681 domain-containing protein [Sphingomonas sp. Y57]